MKINGIRGDGRPYRGNYQITPTSSDITVDKNQILTENLVIKGEPNLKAANIKNGVPMFGVEGTYKTNVINGETVSLMAAEDIAADSFVSVDFSPDDLRIGTELHDTDIGTTIRPFGNSGYFAIFKSTNSKDFNIYHANTDKKIEVIKKNTNFINHDLIIDAFAVDERTMLTFMYEYYNASKQTMSVRIDTFADDYKSVVESKTCEWGVYTAVDIRSSTFKVYGIIPFPCGNKVLVSASASTIHHLFMIDFSGENAIIVNDSIIGFPAYFNNQYSHNDSLMYSYQTDMQKDSTGVYHICQYIPASSAASFVDGIYYYKIELIQDLAYILYPQTLITTAYQTGSFKDFAYAFVEQEGVLHHRIVFENNNTVGMPAFIHPLVYIDMTSNINEAMVNISSVIKKVKWDRIMQNPEIEDCDEFVIMSPLSFRVYGLHFLRGIDMLICASDITPSTGNQKKYATISFGLIVLAETEGYMVMRNVYQPEAYSNSYLYSVSHNFRKLPMPDGKLFLYTMRKYNYDLYCCVLDVSEVEPKVFNIGANRLSGISGLALSSAPAGGKTEVCIGG